MFLSYLFCVTTCLLTLTMIRLYVMMWNVESSVREIQRRMNVHYREASTNHGRNGRYRGFFDNIAQPEKPDGKGQQ